MTGYIEADTPEWHEARLRYVTGTTIASLLGCSPWGTWESELQSYLQGRPFTPKRPTWWGQFDEEHNIRALVAALGGGSRAETVNRFYYKGSLGATTDGFLEVSGDICDSPIQSSAPSYWQRFLATPLRLEISKGNTRGLVEAKLTGDRNKKYWAKEPPLHYWCQAQIQMYVTETPWCVLFARIGAHDMRAHLVTPNQEFLADAIEASDRFLEELKAKQA